MSKTFDFAIIRQITNEDFKAGYRNIEADCETIKNNYEGKEYGQCCLNARKSNETILRYLYGRLVREEKRQPTAGMILNDDAFKSKVENLDLKEAAAYVQKNGSEYGAHDKQTYESEEQYQARIARLERDLPQVTEKVLENFSTVLQLAIPYINEKISSVRGKLSISFIPNYFDKKYKKTVAVLQGDLTDVLDRNDYEYQWFFRTTDGDTFYGDHTRVITINRDLLGKTVVFKAFHKYNGQQPPEAIYEVPQDILQVSHNQDIDASINSNPLMIRRDLNNEKNSCGVAVVLVAKLPEGETAKTVQWGFVKYDNTVQKLKNKLIDTLKFYCTKEYQDKEGKTKKNTDKTFCCEVICESGNRFYGTYPMSENDFLFPMDEQQSQSTKNSEDNNPGSKLSAEEPVKQDTVSATEPVQHDDIAISERKPIHHAMPESFDGHATAIYQNNERFNSLGKIYYFVCKDSERFILNSLEEVSYRDYLYQLLREHGYKRVVIICEENRLHNVYAFDDETQRLFSSQTKSSPKLNGLMPKHPINQVGNELRGNMAQSSVAGARVVRMIYSTDSKNSNFGTFVEQDLKPLVEDAMMKTAVAMPLSLLKRDMDESLANDIRKMLAVGNNIIVLTANTIEDLGDILPLADSFGTLDSDIKRARGIAQARAASHYCVVSAVLEGYEDEKRKKKVENAKNRLIECYSNLGIDEVANYISRKKYIESDPLFNSLRPTEIYSFAEKVIEELRKSKNAPTFEAIHYFFSEKQDKITKILAHDRLWARMPIEMIGIPSTALSRVVGSVERYQLSEEERQVIRAEANSSLDKMIGLSSVKTQIYDLNAYSTVFGGERSPGHYVFAGNPGTGKTVVARLMGKLLHAEGLLNTDRVKEVSKEDLVSENIGGTAMKTAKVCEDALDGVLFVDEAYQLVNTENTGKTFPDDFCEEAYTTLMRFMENNRDRICVIFAGYTDKMQRFVEANPGMKSRISNTVVFPDYSDDELLEIIKLQAKEKSSKMKENLQLSEDYISALRDALGDIRKDEGDEFANGRTMRLILEKSINNAARRIDKNRTTDKSLIGADLPENYRIDDTPPEERDRAYIEAMAELNHMIGLKPVKDELETLLAIKKVFPDEDGPGNYIFAGKPGTGKTTVAKMLGKILKAQGLLNTDKVVEVIGKTDLVGTVVGESGKKTLAKCKEALNGVLFIDEAYSLVNCDEGVSGTYPDSYSEEAYTTILQFMENNRGRICVIFAGYTNKMEKFVAANEGMGSRIKNVIEFPDYTDAELVEIFTILAEEKEIQLSSEFSTALENVFAAKKKEEELKARKTGKENAFGNAREARKLLELCRGPLAKRVIKEGLKERVLILEDLPEEYRNIHILTDPPAPKPIYKRIPAALIHDLPNPFKISFPSEETVLGSETEKAILFVKTDRGAGTAFLISPDGYALTCAHVIADKETSKEYGNYKARMLLDAHYETRAEMWFDFEVVNMSVGVDMALIKLNRDRGSEQDKFLKTYCNGNFPYLKLYESKESIPKGSKCIVQGYPFGDTMANDSSQDPVSIKSFQRDMFGDYISLSGEAKCGNSGSPVISLETGLVVGVVNGSITNKNDKLTEEVNYMRPIQYFWSEFTI